jgi:hypothetical protein
MIRMSELLEDPTYRRFMTSKPKMPKHLRDPQVMMSAPWVVYIQRESGGPWGKKSFWKYKDALEFLSRAVYKHHVWDACLNNKRYGFEPPQKLVKVKGKYVNGVQVTKYIRWVPKLGPGEEDHHWCKYCRRPTVFKFYSRHKVLGNVTQDIPRCCICGASARIAVVKGDRLYTRF